MGGTEERKGFERPELKRPGERDGWPLSLTPLAQARTPWWDTFDVLVEHPPTGNWIEKSEPAGQPAKIISLWRIKTGQTRLGN